MLFVPQARKSGVVFDSFLKNGHSWLDFSVSFFLKNVWSFTMKIFSKSLNCGIKLKEKCGVDRMDAKNRHTFMPVSA
jgi:hypothetical protein